MSDKEQAFLQKLQATFKVEAEEYIQTLTQGLLALEGSPPADEQAALLEAAFREVHSLKGASRAVNRTDIEAVCGALEGVFAALKRAELDLSRDMFDTLHAAVETVDHLLASSKGGQPVDQEQIHTLVQRLGHLEAGRDVSRARQDVRLSPAEATSAGREPGEPGATGEPKGEDEPRRTSTVTPEGGGLSETVRIPITKLMSLLALGEELGAFKQTGRAHVSELQGVQGQLDVWARERKKVAPYVAAVRKLLANEDNGFQQGAARAQLSGMLDFLDWSAAHAQALDRELSGIAGRLERDYRLLGRTVSLLLDETKTALMFPVSMLLEICPKVARTLSRDQGKEVEVVIEGSEIEIDRRILEEFQTPLIHMLRNCVDHGIEKPETREQCKKPRRGAIRIAVAQLGADKVELLISDDGAGIDLEKVAEIAVQRGLLSEQERGDLDESGAVALLFRSGLSTSPIITDISGRGLGLAIVREKVEQLGGQIGVETAIGAGTSFRIVLPLTLATSRGVLVRAAGQLFVLPTRNVERAVRVEPEEIRTVEGQETISLDGSVVPLVRLESALKLAARKTGRNGRNGVPVLLLNASGEQVGFSVDEVLGEREVAVRQLGRQLSHVRNVAGATVLESGEVALILDVAELIQFSKGHASGLTMTGAQDGEAEKSILLVEDSITSRMLLKSILEAAGYLVTTVVDGSQAWAALREKSFDLVVSDIEMPRMNGFELTSRIRKDKKFAELPVVLVTSLESPADKEQGMDVGANAYIVKSSFDQSNLLDVIGSLL